ncbi:MAG: AAA family ATPase [Methylococcales bacterium]
MIQAEYFCFLQTLNNDSTSEGVRKVANLALAHLDELIPLTTHQGQRVRKMVALLQSHWETASAEIQPLPENIEVQQSKITQLKSMTVGPFRGFARQEVFDLASQLVLIYGPNGTGKSSFCEALEYGLLGNVIEAESKRFRDQRDYLRNAHVNQFAAPMIAAVDEQGNEVVVTSSEALYRFCFVEKNRIDSFSRIAAQAPAKQTELISTLFGLESFTEFVRNFTAEIDDRYIDLIGRKAVSLAQKRQSLAGAEQQINTNSAELQEITIGEQKFANQYREGADFSQVVFELNGNEETPGLIQQIEAELQQSISAKSNLTSAALDELGNSITINVAGLVAKQQELAAASQQVSFKQLYEAVSQVQQSSTEECPACKTPLNQVVVNPYTYAGEELQKLQELALVQQSAQQLEISIQQSLFSLIQIINTCLRYYPQNNALQAYQLINNEQPNVAWWNSLLLGLPDGFILWHHIVSQVKQLEDADKAIVQVEQVRTTRQAELNRLREIERDITIFQTRRNTANTAITTAQQLINNFDTENAQLIADVEAEKSVVLKNKTIASAYSSFVNKLNTYCNSLPAQLVADLSEIVVTLYNAFNRNDSVGELFAQVKLPLAQNQRLEIAFQSDPAKLYDALHVLSEGHIRCLGLAILLAKNLKENAPLLIFDDPVNAIDDEHRNSIRLTLFQDEYFKDKQIILAVHGNEFFKDTHQVIGREAAQASESYVFRQKTNEQHIQVSSLRRPKNYVLAASELYEQGDYRDSLMSARRALEELCNKVWWYFVRNGGGLVSISKRNPDAPWDLRMLAEKLKSEVNKEKYGIPNKEEIVGAFDTLLGENGQHTHWVYLNKGTHEENDREEFDQAVVSDIVRCLIQLDTATQR